jgi:hypothetical protein
MDIYIYKNVYIYISTWLELHFQDEDPCSLETDETKQFYAGRMQSESASGCMKIIQKQLRSLDLLKMICIFP